MSTRLFDIEVKARRKGTTTALVALDPKLCPTCGDDVMHVTTCQPALLRHGGYGATLEVVTAHCWNDACRWMMQLRQTEISPR